MTAHHDHRKRERIPRPVRIIIITAADLGAHRCPDALAPAMA